MTNEYCTISKAYITELKAQAFFDAIESNKKANALCIQDCTIDETGTPLIFEALRKNPAIRKLSLIRNRFDAMGEAVFNPLLKDNATLTTLEIVSVSLDDDFDDYYYENKEGCWQTKNTRALLEAIKANKRLKAFYYTNAMTDDNPSTHLLLDILQHKKRFSDFGFSCYRKIDDASLAQLIEHLKDDSSLITLELSNNHLEDKDAIAICHAITNNPASKIEVLCLQDNNLTEAAKTKLGCHSFCPKIPIFFV